ncbi:hypothetical protein ACQ4LE_003740 [Meloidogyne hapla]|uniref:Uncharacterized protein n=1 Tax=Meloidogyne hapla TaxID=6305 RepID=A0A1I8BQ02_MELHA
MKNSLYLTFIMLAVLCFTVQMAADISESILSRAKRYGGFGYFGGCDACGGGGYFGGYAPPSFYAGGCDTCGGYRSYYGYFG